MFLTTPTDATIEPTVSTSISLSPQTSISVQHTVVRNKPAYPYPYTESTLQTDATEDTSYYYTYEDISEDASKQITSTVTAAPSVTTIRPTVRSFWNSQKAMLDARRKESAQKFIPTYNKPTTAPKDSKPTIEFKVREKPKFGLANKNKQFTTTTTMKPETTTTTSTTPKMVKTDIKSNLPIQNLSEKDLLKSLKDVNTLPNQIIGRVGELPIQSNLASLQSQLKAQSTNINSFTPTKFDNNLQNVQFVNNARTPQSTLTNVPNQASLQSNLNQLALLNALKSLNAKQSSTQQRSGTLNSNQPAQSSSQAIQTLLNFNQNQQPLLNLDQNQQSRANNNLPPGNAFISASAPIGTSGRAPDITIQAPAGASGLLQRLGALANGANGDSSGIVSREGGGGYGGNNGFSVNLGPVPDPLTFFLRLLQLIPRPLLDLNGRIFFGIELGKNAGIVSGAGAGGGAKPVYSG